VRDSNVEELAERLRQANELDAGELRELIPSVLILEGVAIRQSPPFDADAIAGLKEANQRLRDSAGDADAAARADDDFHHRLTASCGNTHVLEVLDLVHRALMRYERLYLLSPERLTRSVAEHEAIIEAVEAGDHALAAERVRVNFTSGLPDMDRRLEEP
jgi:DNA-binding GntR family transcriptional regulator